MATPVTIRIVGDLDPAQPLDADLTALAANITAAGHALVDDASAAAQRTTLGLVAGGAGDIWVEKAGDTLTGDLTMQSAGAATNLDTYSLTATTASLLTFRKSNDATVGVQGAVTHDPETLGNIIFYGSDGTAFREAARITAQTDTTPGPSDMPGRLSIRTTPDGATSATEKIYISRSGVIINEQGLAHEFRVESDTLTHAIYIDPNTGEPRLGFLAGIGSRLVLADAEGDLGASATLSAFGTTLIDDADADTARTTLGVVAGGAGDIWVEKAGDVMTGVLRNTTLAGAGERQVEADADGDLSATRPTDAHLPSATGRIRYVEEFDSIGSASGDIGTHGWGLTVNGTGGITTEAGTNHPGAWVVTAGAAANDYTSINKGAWFHDSHLREFEMIWKQGGFLTQQRSIIGWIVGSTAALNTGLEGVIALNQNAASATNWFIRAYDGGVLNTALDTGILCATNHWYRFRAVRVSAGVWDVEFESYTANATYTGQVTGADTAVAKEFMFQAYSTSAAARSLVADYAAWVVEASRET